MSDRQREYIVLVCRPVEPTPAQIAEHMGITEKTVETHRAKVYKKLDVHSRMELLFAAVRLGIVACPCGAVKGEGC